MFSLRVTTTVLPEASAWLVLDGTGQDIIDMLAALKAADLFVEATVGEGGSRQMTGQEQRHQEIVLAVLARRRG